MYIFGNALKNIWRNKGRNILFAIIVFVIIPICTMGALVRNSSTKLVDRYHQQFGSKVTIAPDMSSGNMQIKSPTTEQLLDFGKSDLLQSTRYTAKVSILPDKLTLLDESEDMPGKSVMTGIDENGKKMSGPLHNPKTTLIGYDSPNISDDFTDSKRKIIEGKACTDGEKECLISQQLAKLNNLKLGDTVSVTVSDYADEVLGLTRGVLSKIA